MSIVQRLDSFTIVGLVAFVVDFCLFNVFSSWLGADPVVAKVLSVAAATAVSWAGSRYVTFRELLGNVPRYFSYRYVVFRPSTVLLSAATSATPYATGDIMGRVHA
ncbi:GtrA family protein [Arthrobacter sp.]|uniref:GtrA family protein n=1 Tax=Arthrobacter sp. TaxID=1667 RepID=UPI002810A866|nr:GtrA family protein [Arthrobacter sp.]